MQSQQIRTFVRIKPNFTNDQKIVYKKNNYTLSSKSNNSQDFIFDSVFDQNITNEQVYAATTQPIVKHSFNGYNSCILAYGQTFSGKTYTMKGTPQNPGIIPLCLREIFHKIQQANYVSEIILTYMEIYNQNIIDLLSDRQNIVQLRQDEKKQLKFQGITQVKIYNIQQAMDQFQKGQQKRKFASNSINKMSSRSHVIFRINLKLVDSKCNQIFSQINLVDLAGSQGIHRTKAEGSSKVEGENINKSILALSKVIKSMSERQNFINFRDSKLTRILQTSLCSNSKSTIICNINPNRQNYQQTINTLKFGRTASKVKISTIQNLIQSQQVNSKLNDSMNNSLRNYDLLPSEKNQLLQLRQIVYQLRQKNNQLQNKCKQYQNDLYKNQNDINRLNDYVETLCNDLKQKTRAQQYKRQQLWQQKQSYQNRLQIYQDQLHNLQQAYNELKIQNRQLQKNQKSLTQSLQHYENQVKQLQGSIVAMKTKISDEYSKSSKLSASRRKNMNNQIFISNLKNKNTNNNNLNINMNNNLNKNMNTTKLNNNYGFTSHKNEMKPNPFQNQRYHQFGNRISIQKINSIIQLKCLIIDIGRQLNQYVQANMEIAEQNQQLRSRFQQLENQIENRNRNNYPNTNNKKSNRKINPSEIQFNQIRKLNHKIKKLKKQLEMTKERQRKNRELVKKYSNKQVQQLSEFQQWYQLKYNAQDFRIQKAIQTSSTQQQNPNDSKQKSSNNPQEQFMQKQNNNSNYIRIQKSSIVKTSQNNNNQNESNQKITRSFIKYPQQTKANRSSKKSKSKKKQPYRLNKSEFTPQKIFYNSQTITEDQKQLQI